MIHQLNRTPKIHLELHLKDPSLPVVGESAICPLVDVLDHTHKDIYLVGMVYRYRFILS